MRDLVVSTVIVVLLITIWLLFFGLSNNQLAEFGDNIMENIIPLVESENWHDAVSSMEDFNGHWQKYKKTALLFLDTQFINEIDLSVAKCEKYIQAEDVSNSSGELLSLRQQLVLLSANDRINLANIL